MNTSDQKLETQLRSLPRVTLEELLKKAIQSGNISKEIPTPDEKYQEICLNFPTKEIQSLEKTLSTVFPSKTPRREALLKKAVKAYAQEVRSAKRQKSRSQGRKTPSQTLLRKKYLTSRGTYVPLGNMERSYLYNAKKKMERQYRYVANKGKPAANPSEAFPSLPGFAGYDDLVAMLNWHEKQPWNSKE